MREVKLCKDCVHFFENDGPHPYCVGRKYAFDLIKGARIKLFCRHERGEFGLDRLTAAISSAYKPCGPKGRHWKKIRLVEEESA